MEGNTLGKDAPKKLLRRSGEIQIQTRKEPVYLEVLASNQLVLVCHLVNTETRKVIKSATQRKLLNGMTMKSGIRDIVQYLGKFSFFSRIRLRESIRKDRGHSAKKQIPKTGALGRTPGRGKEKRRK